MTPTKPGEDGVRNSPLVDRMIGAVSKMPDHDFWQDQAKMEGKVGEVKREKSLSELRADAAYWRGWWHSAAFTLVGQALAFVLARVFV